MSENTNTDLEIQLLREELGKDSISYTSPDHTNDIGFKPWMPSEDNLKELNGLIYGVCNYVIENYLCEFNDQYDS